MNELKKIIRKYGFNVKKYKQNGKIHIISTDSGTYCIKKKQREDLDKILSYLKAKQFNNILNVNQDDEYEITNYIEELPVLNEDKAMEAIYLMSMLHNKTTFYKSISLDDVKCFYENQVDKIIELKSYFDNLCYIYDSNLFLSPSQYLFIRNITVLFNALDYSKFYINKWYDIAKNKNSKRVAMNHNNLELSHIIMSNSSYILNWNHAKIDTPVMDLYRFFRKNFSYININSLFGVYSSKYQLLPEEVFLLFSHLLLPDKIEIASNEINNIKEIYDMYSYLSVVMDFISEYNLKYNK